MYDDDCDDVDDWYGKDDLCRWGDDDDPVNKNGELEKNGAYSDIFSMFITYWCQWKSETFFYGFSVHQSDCSCAYAQAMC